MDKIERTVNHFEYQSHQWDLLQCYSREEQMQSVLKLITREEKARGQVQLKNRARGNLAAMFSSGRKEPGNQFDHLFSQARFDPMRQEHQVRSLKNCISELQQ